MPQREPDFESSHSLKQIKADYSSIRTERKIKKRNKVWRIAQNLHNYEGVSKMQTRPLLYPDGEDAVRMAQIVGAETEADGSDLEIVTEAECR